MKNMKYILLSLIIISIASACPFCSGGDNEASNNAYRASTLVLAFLPAVIGGIGFFVFKI